MSEIARNGHHQNVPGCQPETVPASFEQYATAFAERMRAAPEGSDQYEYEYRNLLLASILQATASCETTGFRVADAQLSYKRALGETVLESNLQCTGMRSLWRKRARQLFAGIVSKSNTPLPSDNELLESLYKQDGRFTHDLDKRVF